MLILFLTDLPFLHLIDQVTTYPVATKAIEVLEKSMPLEKRWKAICLVATVLQTYNLRTEKTGFKISW